ncbi:caspase domain-containing protein [Bradyrhizobium sp. 44]|uniref:caspase family protein n=1 Tax=Bradyrhizobium sp. 44 TaxID=2782675 RepID=UPI00387EB9CB
MCVSAHGERRVALVLGNSAYKSVPKLSNPANDAALVGGMFQKAGFDWIDIRTDLNASEMRKALRDFGGRARDAEVAVIYYAGHGIELDGTNYLIPTDAALETDSDVLDETVALDRALFAVEPAKQLRLIILDACRDNPFAKNDETDGCCPCYRSRSCKGRAVKPEHDDRVRGESAGPRHPMATARIAHSPQRLSSGYLRRVSICARRSASGEEAGY